MKIDIRKEGIMKDDNCIFCRIAGGDIPSSTIYEDEDFRAILDLGPASKGHALILPKNHYKDVCELDADLAAKVLPLAGKIGAAMKEKLGCAGFNLVQNNGSEAGQTVYHFHMHIIPRYEKMCIRDRVHADCGKLIAGIRAGRISQGIMGRLSFTAFRSLFQRPGGAGI